MNGQLFIVRGQVQGVGFRPAVWRLASEMGLSGDVRNTSEGAEIRLWGDAQGRFPDRLLSELPDLAKVDGVEVLPLNGLAPEGFSIQQSAEGDMRARITPDAACCSDCLTDIRDPFSDRYRYAFTTCTNCGPRFSIIVGAPYDRGRTTMRAFELCDECKAEFTDPADRRFHAQPIACYRCGPKAWLEHLGGGTVNAEVFSMMDDVDAAGGALKNGYIVAVKGLGGLHLACDATREPVVRELRSRKRRPAKPFALMARDVEVIKRYAMVSAEEEALLLTAAAPIVLLRASGEQLPDCVAPGLDRLGFMLAHTPIHHLMLRRMERPIIMTSGNVSGQPQCIDNDDARERLSGIATFALLHDRDIANRIDDSVLRVDLGQARILRRARGYAPGSMVLPPGFNHELQVLAMGSDLKNTFCLVKDGHATVSQHLGDLEDFHTSQEAERALGLFSRLFDHNPDAYAVDEHPGYFSTRSGRTLAADKLVVAVQHHHAHIVACLAENQHALGAGCVLGIVMDGSGMGDDGTVWGGEFMLADYCGYQREACLKPVALPGGATAAKEPWRNAYAHLMAEMGWAEFAMNFTELEVFSRLQAAPRAVIDGMIQTGTNTPMASSCGRLFDAAAALTGIAWDQQAYEGEAAMLFEAAIDVDALGESEELMYPFTVPHLARTGMPYIEPLSVWRAMLGDLLLGTPIGTIAARFHRGLAAAIVAQARRIAHKHDIDKVVLSGGCFQNATLFELVHTGLESADLIVLSHSTFPANDGGLALGQAVSALARIQQGEKHVSRHTGSDHRNFGHTQ